MPYLTYRTDMQRALRSFRAPAKKWGKSAVKIHDPFKLFGPTVEFVVHGLILSGKALFFTVRKVLDR